MARARLEPYRLSGLAVTDAATDGRGIGRTAEGQVVFVEGAVPGDVVEATVYHRKRGLLEARLERIETPSPERVMPACAHFGTCGGCKWQHQSYAGQLRFKEKQVRDAFARIAGLPEVPILPIIGAPAPYRYRNKLEFSFAPQRYLERAALAGPPEQVEAARRQPALGYHAPGAFDKVLHISSCHLMDARVDALRNRIYELSVAQGLSFHDIRSHTGWLRSLIVRRAEATDQWIVILTVYEENAEAIDRLYTPLAAEFEWVSGWLWMVNPRLNDSTSDLPAQVWRGHSHIEEQLHNRRFSISPHSFFQTNSQQAQRLYQVAFSFVKEEHLEPVDILYDLYCGAGSIGISGHGIARQTVGIEYVTSAVADAEVNVQLNELSGYRFIAGDLAKVLDDSLVQQVGRPDVVITDPPRGGMDEKVVRQLLRIAPQTIVYVSCNVGTQARDVLLLTEKYDVLKVQPVDMFPQTSHIESVALLTLRR